MAPDSTPRLMVLVVPVLLHGSYNFCLMAVMNIFGVLLAVCVNLVDFVFARRGVSVLAGVPSVRVDDADHIQVRSCLE